MFLLLCFCDYWWTKIHDRIWPQISQNISALAFQSLSHHTAAAVPVFERWKEARVPGQESLSHSVCTNSDNKADSDAINPAKWSPSTGLLVQNGCSLQSEHPAGSNSGLLTAAFKQLWVITPASFFGRCQEEVENSMCALEVLNPLSKWASGLRRLRRLRPHLSRYTCQLYLGRGPLLLKGDFFFNSWTVLM